MFISKPAFVKKILGKNRSEVVWLVDGDFEVIPHSVLLGYVIIFVMVMLSFTKFNG